MRRQPFDETRPDMTAPPTAEVTAPELRALVEAIHAHLPPRREDDADLAGQIVLELTVQGTTYRLLRSSAHPDAPPRLSPREREIAQLVASGQPNKTIAHTLAISPWTVATYLKRIYAKLEVNSRPEMVAQVLKFGLLAQQPSR